MNSSKVSFFPFFFLSAIVLLKPKENGQNVKRISIVDESLQYLNERFNYRSNTNFERRITTAHPTKLQNAMFYFHHETKCIHNICAHQLTLIKDKEHDANFLANPTSTKTNEKQ
jgi:hypothetical protein